MPPGRLWYTFIVAGPPALAWKEEETRKFTLQKITKIRGVKGAASWCALSAVCYLAALALTETIVSFFMGLRVEGATLTAPVGFPRRRWGF